MRNLRIAFGDWLIALIVGAVLWYRNTGPDRLVGIFILALSLVFAAQYALSNNIRAETAEYLIILSVVVAIVSVLLLMWFQSIDTEFIVIVVLVLGIWILLSVVYPNVSRWLGIISSIIFASIGFAYGSDLLVILAIILLLISLVDLYHGPTDVYSDQAALVLVVAALYWILAR